MASKKKQIENQVEAVEKVTKETYLSLANKLLTAAKEKGYETSQVSYADDNDMDPVLLKRLIFDDNWAKAFWGVTMTNRDLDAEELRCPTHGIRGSSGPLGSASAFEWGKAKAENLYCNTCGTRLELVKIEGIEPDPWKIGQRSCLNVFHMEPELVEREMITYLNLMLDTYGKPETVAAAEGGEPVSDVPSVQEAVPAEKE